MRSPLEEYKIPFSSLKYGMHDFHFEVGDAFFEAFEYSLIKKGNVKVDLAFERRVNSLVLDFNLFGSFVAECDRCLSEVSIPFECEHRIVVQFTSKESEDEDDDLVTLPEDAWQIDVSPYIYEFITLETPLRTTCDMIDGNSCDEEMETYIKGNIIEDSSEEISEETENIEDEIVDPRWEALKKLKTNN